MGVPWILAVKSSMTTLFCSAGEASGDGSCARLIHQLRSLSPQTRFVGIGGPKLRAEGVQLWYDTSNWGTIGFVEAMKRLPVIWLTSLLVRARMYRVRPDALLLVDYGAFNTRLAQWYKRWIGGEVFYYFPPGSWRKQAASRCDLAGYTDLVITPFPWSYTYLRERGVNAYHYGHPMLDTLAAAMPRQQFRAQHGLSEQSVLIGLLPGSRNQEIRHNMPVMIESIKSLKLKYPDVKAMVAIGNETEYEWVIKLCAQSGVEVTECSDVHGLMSAADILWCCSGTATLEAAVIGTPMLIMYKASQLLGLEYNLLKHKIPMIGMPNLICESMVVPELIQNEANPERILLETKKIWPGSPGAEQQRKALSAIREQLGQPGATLCAAQTIAQRMHQNSNN